MKKRRNPRKNCQKTKENSNVFVISTYFNAARDLIETNNYYEFCALLDVQSIGVNDIGEIGGSSLLMVAAECGNLKIVQELIRRGADPNYQDSDNWSALITSSKENQIDIVSELIEAGAKIDATDMGGWTSLFWSAYLGHLEIAKILLKKGASANVYDNHHMTPLIWASGRGCLEIVIMLLAHAAKPDAGDKYGTTPLIWSCRKGHYEIAQKLLKVGASADTIGMFGWTPLLVAVRGNFENLVELLISYKPNVNACGSNGLTALMIACKEGYINIVNALLHANSYVNLCDRNGDNSLIQAAKSGHVLIVEALIKAHADVDHQGADKKTALYWAVEKGHYDVIKAILKANPNLELSTKEGDTPLLKAVRCRRLPIVKLLIDKKAKVSATDKYGDSCLHIAFRAQSKAIVEFLLRNPRNSPILYKPNKRGETPFTLDNSHQKPILPTLFGATPSSRRVLEKETQLGYDLYSSAIANLLSEPTLKLPICVGLFAKWGTGKSFLIGKLKDDLILFTKDWTIKPTFRFSWSIFLGIMMLSMVTGVATIIGNNGKDYLLTFVAMASTFAICYIILGVIYCGHLKYDWSISTMLRKNFDSIKLILQICFGRPPMLNYDQISALPVRFLFPETPIKISSDYSVFEMVSSILSSLWVSMENQIGFLPIRLYRVFLPEHVSGSSWKWKRICCMIPTIFLVIISFFTLGFLLFLIYIDKFKPFTTHPFLSYLLVALVSISSAWILVNLLTPFKIIKEIVLPTKKKSREELKKDVELMQSCIMCLDAFNGKRQSRIVIVLDALESIYESDRLISLLESINVYFINCSPINSNRLVSPSFVIIITLDPHHHITSKSQEYLKTLIHLPFYLQNSQLRRVKIAQQAVSKVDRRLSTNSLMDAIAAAPIPHPKSDVSTLLRSKVKKGGLLKSTDSIISMSAHPNDSLIKVLLTDDYFSDVNPKSIRRIMNIVYIVGRLLKAFNIDFDWHHLTSWINITEQWPLRATSLITYWEMFENKYTDDTLPLKTVYDKIVNFLPSDLISSSADNDEKKFIIFLSYHHNSLTLGDLKTFSPFTINLDPYLKKNLQEAWSTINLLGPMTYSNRTQVSLTSQFKPQSLLHLDSLSVDDIIALLEQIDAFDTSNIERYAKNIKQNNINGKVLMRCSQNDFNELKNVLGFSFGDWLLFKNFVTEATQVKHEKNLQDIYSQAQLSFATQTQPCSFQLSTNLEKQVTMEETALASTVITHSPIEEEPVEANVEDSEVGVFYLGNGMKMSPSVSFQEGDKFPPIQSQNNHIIEIGPEPNECTPLVSPSKQSYTSTSLTGTTCKRHPLERQHNFGSSDTNV